MVYKTALPLSKADKLRLEVLIDKAKDGIQDARVEGDYEYRKECEITLLALELLKEETRYDDEKYYEGLTSNPVDRGDNTGKSKW
jgi:hypothetical protein